MKPYGAYSLYLRYALCLSAGPVGGCSLVFDEAPALPDGALTSPDATDDVPMPQCGLARDDTTARFSVNEAEGTETLHDTIGDVAALSQQKDGNGTATIGLSTAAGPIASCGGAVQLGGEEKAFVRIPADPIGTPASFDFWFTAGAVPTGTDQVGGLLVKDAQHTQTLGDMGV